MNRLKELRKNKRLTQAELAKIIGINQNSYSYWENGKVKIDNQSLQKLAELFNVSIDYILNNENVNSYKKLTEREIDILNLTNQLNDI